MKKFALKFIQIAWVAETIALIVFSIVASVCLSPERVNLWHQLLPILGGLIAAQGTAAGAGPLLADQINKSKENGGK